MMDRRQFLKSGLALTTAFGGAGALPFGFESLAHADAISDEIGVPLLRGSRTLDLYRPATGERLKIEYLREGQWLGDAYSRICWALRDVQAQQFVQMDTRLIAIMDWTQHYLRGFGYTQPLHILSGYRTERTNARTEGAVKDSQHRYGKAIDVRIPGLSTEYLGKLYRWLAQGGVGIYDEMRFVHVDTGRLRTWRS